MLHVLDRHTVGSLLRTKEVDAWGVAANDPRLPLAPELRTAISILARLDPLIVHGIRRGPTPDYQREYRRVNALLDDAAETLVSVLRAHGHAAERLPATVGAVDGRERFAHKTAATTAGLGWIGKMGLLVTSEFGSAVRLATVFTDLELPPGDPVVESGCGTCRACVDACPAGCGRDVLWQPGMPRELLFDADACRRHMAEHASADVEICGVCIAACPYSRR